MIKKTCLMILAAVTLFCGHLYAQENTGEAGSNSAITKKAAINVSAKEKAITDIKNMLRQNENAGEALPGFEITMQGEDEWMVNGTRLEDLDPENMARLLVLLSEKFYLESEEDSEKLEEDNEEFNRIKELQEQNERIRQTQDAQRNQEILRQTQLNANRPAPVPARPPSRPPSPPSLPSRR